MIFKGIAFALSACLIWGLIFVIPQFMSSFSSIEIVLGRYGFYGTISFLLFLKARLTGGCRYPLSVWIKAISLSFLSGYYLWVILAIRYTSPEICALILGTSPITIAFYGNWKQKEGNFKLLIIPSLLILIGLVLINAPHIGIIHSSLEYVLGLVCSLVSLISWSLYVVLNSRFLKNNPRIISNEWTTIQGVATFSLTLLVSLVYVVFSGEELNIQKYFSWNPEARNFLIGCAVLGFFCSWVGAFLWNKASIYLPISLAGQLMIFETIFGVLFVYMLNQQLPSVIEAVGGILLLGAVVYGIRTLNLRPSIREVRIRGSVN